MGEQTARKSIIIQLARFLRLIARVCRSAYLRDWKNVSSISHWVYRNGNAAQRFAI